MIYPKISAILNHIFSITKLILLWLKPNIPIIIVEYRNQESLEKKKTTANPVHIVRRVLYGFDLIFFISY